MGSPKVSVPTLMTMVNKHATTKPDEDKEYAYFLIVSSLQEIGRQSKGKNIM